eukprot:TRINITY_DN59628_c0_g1_i1.p1 TRINITY_DN59628_c0_g1~~TRINITY_DN59628_c0_g1_i1.p1  ORF type:complete len:320 (+),score=22.78 TRINITY_DN59628_c0_g1_i1:53-961(+)
MSIRCTGVIDASDAINSAVVLLSRLFSQPNCRGDAGHGVDHAIAVLAHVDAAIKAGDPLSEKQRDAVRLAALLHDADDRKLFPRSREEQAALQTPYPNASAIVEAFRPGDDDLRSLVLRMIGLVSCSGNGNDVGDTTSRESWLLWPRWADRLEAIGAIGVHRCVAYSNHRQRYFALPSTPRATSEEALREVCTPELFASYVATGRSLSTLDHFYDKLLHLSDPAAFRVSGADADRLAGDRYFQEGAAARHAVVVQFVLTFGRTGKVVMPPLPPDAPMEPVTPLPEFLSVPDGGAERVYASTS